MKPTMVARATTILILLWLAAVTAHGQSRTLIADALDWYAIWGGPKEIEQGPQACKGSHKGSRYALKCDPMSVLISLTVDDAGRCSITNMSAISSHEGPFHVDAFEPARPPQACGELPSKNGDFQMTIVPLPRPVDESLSARAHSAAKKYFELGMTRGCALHYPEVKQGDPFFHLYEVCSATVKTISEFTIRSGEPSGFPHWTYMTEKHDLTVDAGWRLKKPDLWLRP